MAMCLLAKKAMQRLKVQHAMLSSSSLPARADAGLVTCGRGDKKTKRGKRFKGSFGNARPKKEKKIQRIKDRIEVPRSTPWPLPFKLI
ncbi:30S ribosomal protein S31, mitochondrial [Apostasia shenzhenica]|uniref:30S ribosomal protein S31, mitochondrial n=1 Tax=Apostasia shenzhenica TaxID=1088818 RepID=A0A2I0BEU3_9ASPA|nr:30S ribosomal protein S31, mitochondrial [Apostasia shenzhenica]